MRGLAALLIAALPAETLGHIGRRLLEAASDEQEGEVSGKIKALNELHALDKPGLDTYPHEPIISLNPAASGRQMEEGMAQLLRQWKQERDLGDRRNRSDKYGDYLKVWDLREGWLEGQYDRSREKKLKEVAAELKLSVTTVHNHYRSAFEMVVGYPYSSELWYRVFGPLKISDLYGQEVGPVSRHRPSKSPTRRDVPETVVSLASEYEHTDGPLNLGATCAENVDVVQLTNDIHTLVAAGLSDEQVVAKLDLSDAAVDVVKYLRQRGCELQ